MSKRLLSILLALCMVLTVLPVSALAADPDPVPGPTETSVASLSNATGVTYFDVLKNAVDSAQAGDTITLLQNATNDNLNAVVELSLKSGVTLNGNGQTISGNIKVTVAPDASDVIIQNVNFYNIHNNAELTEAEKIKYGFTNKVGTLTAIYGAKLNGKFTITGCTFTNVDWDAIQITPKTGAVINITNNTFNTDASCQTVRFVHVESDYNTDFTVNVNGNKFLGVANLNQTGLEVYFPTDANKVNLSGNYMDAPMAVCIGTGGTEWNNAWQKAYPFKDATMTQDVTPVAVMECAAGMKLYLTKEEAAADGAVALIGEQCYETLADAYAAIPRNDTSRVTTIEVLTNCEGGGIGSDGDKGMNYVIDFGGHTYTVKNPAVGSTGTVSQGLRVLQGSKAVFKNGVFKSVEDRNLVQIVHTYGDVTLENFTIDATENPYAKIAYEADCGTLDILGNSSILAYPGKTGLYVAFWHTGTYDGTTVNVDTTGRITGKLVYEFDERKTGADAATENKAILNIKNGNFDISGLEILFTSSIPEDLKVPKINISGGTYAIDVSDYVATNYECVKIADGEYKVQPMEAKLVVTPEVGESGKVSATLEGAYAGPDTTIEHEGDTVPTGNDITVDLSTSEGGDCVTSASLVVTKDTAATLERAESLTVKTDVGTVTLDSDVLDKLSGTETDVVIKITATEVTDNSTVKAAYTIEVTAGNENLLPDGGVNGKVTITVPLPTGTDANGIHPWYVINTQNGKLYVEELTKVPTDEAGAIAFTINHLSDIELLSENPTSGTAAAMIVKNGVSKYYTDLASAIAEATSGDTVKLLRNVESATPIVIPAGVTLDGGNKTITYTGARVSADTPNNGAFITVENDGDDVLIKNVTIEAGENIKHGVQFYCVDGGALENVTVNGAAWTSVIVNGAKNIVLKNCELNPGSEAYANIDFAMGVGVTVIPSMKLEDVSFGSDAPSVWVDKATVDRMKDALPGETTDEQILETVDTSIINLNSGDLGVDIELVPGSETTITKPSEVAYTITFDAMGGSVEPASAETVKGKLTVLPTPVKAGYRFVGWYLRNGTAVTTDTVFTADTTVYAYWYFIGGIDNPVVDDREYPITVTSGFGGEVVCSRAAAKPGDVVILTVMPNEGYELSELSVADMYGVALNVNAGENGMYTFWMPASAVKVQASFVKTDDEVEDEPEDEKPEMSFTDVASDAWYYDAVAYVYENGLMNGTSLTTFGPDVNITRGMIVTILYRLDGEPAASVSNFTDVPANAYYTDAVAWAAENGIVKGYDDGAFGPDDDVTMEQFAAILYRYAAYKGYDVSDSASLNQYTDADDVSGYAVESMQWAVAMGLVKGTSATTLAPANHASRAQIATVLMRFCEFYRV